MSIFDDILAADAAIFSDPDLMPGAETITYTAAGKAPVTITANVERNAPVRGEGGIVTMSTTVFIAASALAAAPKPGSDTVAINNIRGDRISIRISEILKSDAGGYLLRLE